MFVVWGEHDRIFPVYQIRVADDRLWKGLLDVISDCGHLLRIEHPELCAASLSLFLCKRVDR